MVVPLNIWCTGICTFKIYKVTEADGGGAVVEKFAIF